MDVTQVALAHVTGQYLERVRALDTIAPEDLAQFLVIAARLILLKSRRLLPNLQLTAEEEDSILSLEQQLREYQKFRTRAKQLRDTWMSASSAFMREGYLGVTVAFYPPSGMDGRGIRTALDGVLKGLPTMEREREHALQRVISLEHRIRELQTRVQRAAVTSFREAFTKGAQRSDVVVSFLALLELVKQRILSAEQTHAFHDILIRKRPTT